MRREVMSLGSVAERFLFISNPHPYPCSVPSLSITKPPFPVGLEIDSNLILSADISARRGMGLGQKILHRPLR